MKRFEAIKKITWSAEVKKSLPVGQFVTGVVNPEDDTILVYQAFNEEIAEYAVKNQQFYGCPAFSLTRTTWIKPNYLWMMYRCGYCSKKNQERVLAIWLKLSVFEEQILGNAALGHYCPAVHGSIPEHKKVMANSSVVLQWDPYHTPNGASIREVRAIQLGIKKQVVEKYYAKNVKNGGWLVAIEDITDHVVANATAATGIPEEKLITINSAEIRRKLRIGEAYDPEKEQQYAKYVHEFKQKGQQDSDDDEEGEEEDAEKPKKKKNKKKSKKNKKQQEASSSQSASSTTVAPTEEDEQEPKQ